MTRLQELEAAWWDAYWAVRDACADDAEAAEDAWGAVYTAYKAELKRTKEIVDD